MSSPRYRRLASFSVNRLLQETPRSNRARVAHLLKRSPFSSRIGRQGIVSGKQLRHKRKGTETSKARKCLDRLYDGCDEAEGPLIVKEEAPLLEAFAANIVKLPGSESTFTRFVRHVEETYPGILRSQIISSPCTGAVYWLELVSPVLTFDSSIGPINCVRMTLSSGCICSLQVLFPLVRNVWKRKCNI